MRHHKVPGGMKRRVLRWYDYSWSRGRIQGGGDINTALGLLPDKLKTELALHVNLSVLKKVTHRLHESMTMFCVRFSVIAKYRNIGKCGYKNVKNECFIFHFVSKLKLFHFLVCYLI